MKEIPLTQGKVALVDDEDYDYLMQWKWCIIKGNKNNFYARRTDNKAKTSIFMHKVLLGLPNNSNLQGDHIDRNGLNNQKSNLRIATPSDNCSNRSTFDNCTSKYAGVYWDTQRNRWKVYIQKNRKQFFLGRFKNEEDAALAYNKKAILLHGEFANLNQVECGS